MFECNLNIQCFIVPERNEIVENSVRYHTLKFYENPLLIGVTRSLLMLLVV